MKIAAIPTKYNGQYFRSRTEARWAVFFDAMGYRYQYEPEGFAFDVPWVPRKIALIGTEGVDNIRYLPDFWLPDVSAWVEVKPMGGFNQAVVNNLAAFVWHTEHPCLLLEGNPAFCAYEMIDAFWDGPKPTLAEFCARPHRIDMALISEYVKSEHRFYSCPWFETSDQYGEDYAKAIDAVAAERFGEIGKTRF